MILFLQAKEKSILLQHTPQHTPIVVMNSLTKKKEELRTIHPQTLLWYSCGPTVYDHSHLGHARNYVSLDIIMRVLRHVFNYNIVHVMGMTDVDDKIIKRAAEEKITPADLAHIYEKDFIDDMKALNVQLPTVITRVTEASAAQSFL